MAKRSKVLSAMSLGLVLVCGGQTVIAAPASVTAESAQAPKRNSGSSVALWVALGTVLFLAIAAARRRSKAKSGADSAT